MNYEKVLLVDDEMEFTKALSKRMEARGLKVTLANSGSDALEIIENENFDAIILDLLMPEMDGLETLKELLKKNPELQIILLTGYASIEKGIEAIKLGAADFLEKPANIDKLINKIHKAKAKKMLLVEKKLEGKVDEILTKKGW